MYYDYKNPEESKERVKELLEVQKENLSNWETVLKPEPFKALNEFCSRKNSEMFEKIFNEEKFYIEGEVKRGGSLECFVTNYAMGHRNI